MNTLWKYWCWSWISNTSATWYEELAHWKRPWYWERLRAGGEEGGRGSDGWMASLTQGTWVRAKSRHGEGQGSLAFHGVTKSWTWLSYWTTTTRCKMLISQLGTLRPHRRKWPPKSHGLIEGSVETWTWVFGCWPCCSITREPPWGSVHVYWDKGYREQTAECVASVL